MATEVIPPPPPPLSPSSPPSPDAEFNFNSTSTTPFVSAPSSPQRFGNYGFFSAPTTPNNNPTSKLDPHFDSDSEFAFSPQLLNNNQLYTSADELFSGGVIKPLEPQTNMARTITDIVHIEPILTRTKTKNSQKETTTTSLVHEVLIRSKRGCATNTSSWYRKWKLKDLLYFRSASEGDKEKYGVLKKSEDGKYWSFRSADGGGGGLVGRRRRVSVHEWHYTTKREAAEEMRRKTMLPYKRGLLGCLGFGVRQLSIRGFSGPAGLPE